MTHIINIEAGNYQLSELLELVKGGNEVIVQEANIPVAKFIATAPTTAEGEQSQRYGAGLFAGKIKMREDFDEELPMSFWLGEDA